MIPRRVLQCFGVDDKSLGGGSDEVKGITGDERQFVMGRGVQYAHVARLDDFRFFHPVLGRAARIAHLHFVAGLYLSQWTKKRIAMSGQAHVAILARPRRAGYMSHRMPQSLRARPFQNRDGDSKSRDNHLADGRSFRQPLVSCWLLGRLRGHLRQFLQSLILGALRIPPGVPTIQSGSDSGKNQSRFQDPQKTSHATILAERF